jgi:hypothetical protein
MVEIGKVQRTAVPQYSPHFFEKDEFLIQRQGMQRNADSDEVARSFRDDAAHGFRHDVAQGVSLAGC